MNGSGGEESYSEASDCIITGILLYNSTLERWEIQVTKPGAIDNADVYVVRKYKINLPEDTRKEVQATGHCYDMLKEDDRTVYPVGTVIHYIEVSALDFDIDSGDTAEPADCTVSGILCYNSELERWEIRVTKPGAIDSVDIYVVRKYKINLPEDTRKEVQATGRCYDVPAEDDRTVYPAGTVIHYIDAVTIE
jgi:phage head maturation protease